MEGLGQGRARCGGGEKIVRTLRLESGGEGGRPQIIHPLTPLARLPIHTPHIPVHTWKTFPA